VSSSGSLQSTPCQVTPVHTGQHYSNINIQTVYTATTTDWLHENCSNIMVLANFVVNWTILMSQWTWSVYKLNNEVHEFWVWRTRFLCNLGGGRCVGDGKRILLSTRVISTQILHEVLVQASWNEMAHAQKPDFVFRAKRSSPFKSARWRGVSSVDCWQTRCAASAVVMLDTPCSVVVWRVLATHCIRQFPPFTSPPMRHRVPSHFNWILKTDRWWSTNERT